MHISTKTERLEIFNMVGLILTCQLDLTPHILSSLLVCDLSCLIQIVLFHQSIIYVHISSCWLCIYISHTQINYKTFECIIVHKFKTNSYENTLENRVSFSFSICLLCISTRHKENEWSVNWIAFCREFT